MNFNLIVSYYLLKVRLEPNILFYSKARNITFLIRILSPSNHGSTKCHLRYACITFPGKKWKCSECLKDDKGNDGVRDYAIAVTWLAMMDMAHRDMIREGNGPGMMTIWRVNMTRFWRGNKYKYLILGHRLLAGNFKNIFP